MSTTTMLGRKVAADEVGRLDPIELSSHMTVSFRTLELQALCPAVEHIQPDIYDATFTLAGNVSVETKSLKLWLTTFRDQRIFAEHLAEHLAGRLLEVESGEHHVDAVDVTLVQNIRGGIVETVRVSKLRADS